jgi:hypothetical protein
MAQHANIVDSVLFYLQQAVTDAGLMHLDTQKIAFGCRECHRDDVLTIPETYFQRHGRCAIKQSGEANRPSIDSQAKARPEFIHSTPLRRGHPAGPQYKAPDWSASRTRCFVVIAHAANDNVPGQHYSRLGRPIFMANR